MKTFASKEKRSVSAMRKTRPYVHHPMGAVQQAQQAEVRHILRSTGAQARLTIGQPDDEYEQEADRVADQVMRMPDPKLQRQPENEEEEEMLQAKPLADQITSLVQRQEEPEEEEESVQAKTMPGQETAQRQPMEEEEEELQPGYDQEPEESTPIMESVPTRDAGELGGEEEELLQPKSDTGVVPQVTSGIARDIHSIKGSGQPLPKSERAFFEPRFGRDFSQVRVHNDNRAGLISRSINARAFTLGRDVVFGAGQYSPGAPAGRKLLAHELTHVVQQNEAFTKDSNIFFKAEQSSPDRCVGKKLLANEPMNIVQQASLQIYRSPDKKDKLVLRRQADSSRDALEARKSRGRQMAKDIRGAIKDIREIYIKKYGHMTPMALFLDDTAKGRKGPWDQYLTKEDIRMNYKTRDVRHVSYMETSIINTTRHGLLSGKTFLQIAANWNGLWSEALEAVGVVRKGLQTYDVTYRPMVKWMLGGRYKNSVLFYLVRPAPGFWKKMYLWLTSQKP